MVGGLAYASLGVVEMVRLNMPLEESGCRVKRDRGLSPPMPPPPAVPAASGGIVMPGGMGVRWPMREA